ncbi:MAG: hypothetical protein OEM93_20140, partial [Rhodospirillales bacterium]|nr:hypothetical protein [Rhodospirillales bacterium]
CRKQTIAESGCGRLDIHRKINRETRIIQRASAILQAAQYTYFPVVIVSLYWWPGSQAEAR